MSALVRSQSNPAGARSLKKRVDIAGNRLEGRTRDGSRAVGRRRARTGRANGGEGREREESKEEEEEEHDDAESGFRLLRLKGRERGVSQFGNGKTRQVAE